MKNILVCEDEKTIRDFIVINLKRSGYNTVDVDCGEKALEEFNKQSFDIAVLDVMMPGIDGFEVCKQIREKNRNIGIIMLTAKAQEVDRVKGLMLGADDYVAKPFSPLELVARIDAVYRRVKLLDNDEEQQMPLASGPFEINLKSHTISKNGKNIDLTQVEYQIMELFLKNKNTAMERKQILNRIWGENFYGDEKIVDVNIRRLRMKIEENPSSPEYIQTIWGFGYKWQEK